MSASNRPNVKLGVIQCHWTEDLTVLKSDISHKVKQAANANAQIILLQEVFMMRYPGDLSKELNPETFDQAENLMQAVAILEKNENSEQVTTRHDEEIGQLSRTFQFCRELAISNKVIIVGSLFEKFIHTNDETGNSTTNYYNTSIIVNEKGQLIGKTRKQHIPEGPAYNEVDFFEAGYDDYPVHDTGLIKIAVPTCYDQWFPELARIYALKGAELILYPTCIGNEPLYQDLDTQPQWKTMMVSHSICNGIFIAAANRVGKQSAGPNVSKAIREYNEKNNTQLKEEFEFFFYGSSFICAPGGKVSLT